MRLLYILFISVALGLNAQTVTEAEKLSISTAGLSEARLQRIDDMISTAVAEEKIPGAVALVARNGQVAYLRAFGTANHETGRQFRTNDIFRLASQTKAITATAVMMLWEEGKFRLDDPISKFIPEFKEPQVLDSLIEADTTFLARPADKEISIRHLLTHTSGIGYGMIDSDPRFTKIFVKAGIVDAWTTDALTIEANTKKLAKLPLHHNPGEGWTYSEGLDVLGYFIEVVSGMPFDEFLRQRLFEPLGMNDTYFYLPESKNDRLVPVHSKTDGKWTIFKNEIFDVDFPKTGAKTFFSGGAGLSGTAEDYAKFLQMYLNEGVYNGHRILSRTTVQTIMANQIGSLWGDSGSYYGLAFGVLDQKGQDQGGKGSKGTFEWGGYFNTSYFADPVENVIGILLKQTQNIGEDNTGWKFRQLVGQAIDD